MFRSSVGRFRPQVCVLLVLSVLMPFLALGTRPFLTDVRPTPSGPPMSLSLNVAPQQLATTLPPPFSEALRGVVLSGQWHRVSGGQIPGGWVDPRGTPVAAPVRGIHHHEDAGMQAGGSRVTAQKAAAAEELAERAMQDPLLVGAAYQQLAKLVRDDFDGADLDLQSPSLILREWALLDAWVGQRALSQTSVGGSSYAEMIARLDPQLQVLTLELGSDTTLVSIDQAGIGHVAVFRRGDPAPLWRVDRIPEDAAGAAPLRCWRAEAGTRPCAGWRVGLLPPNAQGQQRFYIEAEYAQPAGATRGHQLSVWRWDGRVATPLYVTSYSTGGEAQEEGVSIDGDVIKIRRKDHFQMLMACGACDGRQLVQRLQLTPADEVKELDTISLTPELDLIDALFMRIKEGQPADDLAEPAVIALIRRQWDEAHYGGDTALLINEAETVRAVGSQHTLCFLATSLPGGAMPPIVFTFAGSGTGLRAIAAL